MLTALAEPASTTGLAARTGIPVSSVSEHLAILRAAGLVSATRTGRYLVHQRTALGVALARRPHLQRPSPTTPVLLLLK
jgi:DNA-binding IclR family transcriptional regulator